MSDFEERESVVLQNCNQTIFGIFHKPLTKAPYPAVMICHGLGGDKCGKFRTYVILSEALSRLGIASFRFDFRGSGDSEGLFSDATIESELSDALVGIDYLYKRPDIDNQRIGIFGRSFGGTIALTAAATDERIKCLATWAPVYDGGQWQSLWHHLHTKEVSEEGRQDAMRINGQVPGKPFFQELFALNMEDHLKRLNHVPLLHIHGEQDTIVMPYHADKYRDVRSNASAESEFLLLPHSDHDFSNTKEQKIAIDKTLNWFTKYLLGEANAKRI